MSHGIIRTIYEVAKPRGHAKNMEKHMMIVFAFLVFIRSDAEDSVHHLELVPGNLETLVRLGDELAPLRDEIIAKTDQRQKKCESGDSSMSSKILIDLSVYQSTRSNC